MIARRIRQVAEFSQCLGVCALCNREDKRMAEIIKLEEDKRDCHSLTIYQMAPVYRLLNSLEHQRTLTCNLPQYPD